MFIMAFVGVVRGLRGSTPRGQTPISGFLRFPAKIAAFCASLRFPHLSGTSGWRPQSRYTVSRIECRIKFPQNQRCRAKIALHPPKNQGVAPFSGPPCRTFLSFAAGTGRGGLVEGIAALLGSENGSRYRGVSQLQSHQSRYSVQLSSTYFVFKRRRLASAKISDESAKWHRKDLLTFVPLSSALPTPFRS